MDNQHLRINMEKIIQDLLVKFDLNTSSQLKNSLVDYCLDALAKVVLNSGDLCESDSKNLLSEDHLILILNGFNFGRYISEIIEEKERQKKEERDLGEINI